MPFWPLPRAAGALYSTFLGIGASRSVPGLGFRCNAFPAVSRRPEHKELEQAPIGDSTLHPGLPVPNLKSGVPSLFKPVARSGNTGSAGGAASLANSSAKPREDGHLFRG